ncbi:hypothetical protein I3843_11G162000 [Carya illinoinensis]|nr:hypothetical protein I3843_11G162000 [Carya illinoinensis]
MRLPSTAPASSLKRGNTNPSGPRLRKKHKRLDAICEEEYNRNHGESNEGDGGDDLAELRRSSRVRRAPILLDVSPPPVKKRRKIARSVMLGGEKISKSSSPCESGDLGGEETPGSWKSRLRSRGKIVSVGVQEDRGSPSGKRKLLWETSGIREEEKVVVGELDENKRDLEDGKSMIVKSKRTGRIKMTRDLREGEIENVLTGMEEKNEREEVEVIGEKDEDGDLLLECEMGGENERDRVDVNAQELVEEEKRGTVNVSRTEEGCVGNDNVETVELGDKQVERSECGEEGENPNDVGISAHQAEDGGSHDGKDVDLAKVHDGEDVVLARVGNKTVEHENTMKVEKSKCASSDTLGKPRIKEGRRCGLCGGGTDGKPPKRLIQDAGDSENEAYSGTSGSEEPNYDLWDGFGDEPGWLGRLLGPINDRYGIAGIWVHQHCAVWSPEVYFAGLGCLKNVRAALCRGRALKCTRCGRPGATIGCRVDRCPKTYHLPCARANGCIFDHRKFLIACTDHRHIFQPQGNQYLARIKKLKAKKLKLEMRKLSNDSWRKDIEAEEKWLENCGEDEEFLKRESRRLHRDLLRIAPVYIGGSESESGNLFQGWDSVAGLQDVIRCMKEVVILPLLYPEFFNNLGLTPPRGVLLHGYPGTGKTLVVRALIGACARGDKRIAYFARKGADCLGKYVGDAERQLRLLFQVAERCQPSIIFFDEIDGLAPCRTRQQDQTHSSVVSTLLALLDGLKSRGSVIVIGATNRPDAVDPALRRPGRFDREIYFPLPSVQDRAAILSLHTERWPKPVTGSLLKWIAKRTAGFAGADLQALCTQAAIIALKRNFPLQRILSAAAEKASVHKRLPLPAFAVEERDWLEALLSSPPPCSRREAGIAANDVVSAPLPRYLIPCLLQSFCSLIVSLYLDERLGLPPPISKAAAMIKSVIVSALDKKKMSTERWWSHLDDFLKEADIAKDIESKLSYSGILLGDADSAGSDALNDGSVDNVVSFEPSIEYHGGTCTNLFRNMSIASRSKAGFRILIAGSPRSGQRHLASCLLHCFVGNVDIQKIDMATVSQEGHGDVVQGITQLLMKCASAGPCVVFMPRIDLWAMEINHQVPEESDSCSKHHQFPDLDVQKESESDKKKFKSAEMTDQQCAGRSASHAWSSFIEQAESLCVSTSLMILATSEVPYMALPVKIRQFFRTELSNCSQSTSEHTVPRFSVQIDGKFNRDMVINLSVAELSKDIVQQLVQLIHKKSHIHASSCKEYINCDSIEGRTDTINISSDHGLANERKDKTYYPDESFIKVPQPPNNRTVKGKPSLLFATSTFGYQILRYPHFAELCWVTSKLKEGPSADVIGHWKGWPFNSCIIRPNNSLEKVAVACSASNIRSKEKSGLVRGLIAVGLLSYRGVYSSPREVSIEVRKVLELLVGQINEKVQAGKDRYQYVRLLSQVAYLEDMVNSWVYSLQSLELDTPTMANPSLTSKEFLDNQNAHVDNEVQSEECRPSVCGDSCHVPEVLVESTTGIAAVDIEHRDLNQGNGDSSYPFSGNRVAISEEGSPQKIVTLGHSTMDKLHNSPAVSHLVGAILNEENGIKSGLCRLENSENHAVVSSKSGSSKHSNGFGSTESAGLSENGLGSSSELGNVKLSNAKEVCNQVNNVSSRKTGVTASDGKPDTDEQIIGNSFSSSNNSISAKGVVCFYQCCAECLYNLHGLTQKILIHEWGLNRSHWTVEDVHDVVASLSVHLLSAITKIYVAEDFSNSCDESLKGKKYVECPELKTCPCKKSGNRVVMPVECSCHNISQSCTAKENTSRNNRIMLDSKFLFRDGVLVHLDPDKDVSFHCKYETLCLCSLIEFIAMTKQPFD